MLPARLGIRDYGLGLRRHYGEVLPNGVTSSRKGYGFIIHVGLAKIRLPQTLCPEYAARLHQCVLSVLEEFGVTCGPTYFRRVTPSSDERESILHHLYRSRAVMAYTQVFRRMFDSEPRTYSFAGLELVHFVGHPMAVGSQISDDIASRRGFVLADGVVPRAREYSPEEILTVRMAPAPPPRVAPARPLPPAPQPAPCPLAPPINRTDCSATAQLPPPPLSMAEVEALLASPEPSSLSDDDFRAWLETLQPPPLVRQTADFREGADDPLTPMMDFSMYGSPGLDEWLASLDNSVLNLGEGLVTPPRCTSASAST
jgi:hypothetical protein